MFTAIKHWFLLAISKPVDEDKSTPQVYEFNPSLPWPFPVVEETKKVATKKKAPSKAKSSPKKEVAKTFTAKPNRQKVPVATWELKKIPKPKKASKTSKAT